MAVGHGGRSVDASVTVIIDRLRDRAVDVVGLIQHHLADEIIELRGDSQLLELLRASVAGNVETVFDALRYGIDIERVEPPTAALEYARRVAQHGIPANALVRAYRLGQQQMLQQVLVEVRAAGLDAALALDVFDAISDVTFRYIDWISQQVVASYETERERWVENRNSIRALRVRELLDAPSGPVDTDAVSAGLRYPLRRTHLAVVLWAGANEVPGRELMGLEHFLREVSESLSLRDSPLFVAADRVTAWGWLPLIPGASPDPINAIRSRVAEYPGRLYVAAGTAQSGIDGFRRSHRQAQNARRVMLAGPSDRPFVAAGEPGILAVAMLSEDLAQLQAWVSETLGQLAADTDNDARLRQTLQVFLSENSSYKAAAERLNLHHNSVKYRVQRAVERRGEPIGDDRLDVELALLACRNFGTSVLTPPTSSGIETDRG
ncbi:PucR family transcriptional regulator [Mycobacterium sp. TNTM28]|uniref:PucR family transcriptional regulator n=1 Tax=[Mycobacterium] fortunisiensis TaxID=2600579 RepID=A0ABS6KJB2_9MYCO|nr:helix-turn-helix domain-containing protein [[Mycobacterium] fortunisiensis]MBU9763692.1 PucR family transcriptional regulator [[Mycobacterium] fortunisiensis]